MKKIIFLAILSVLVFFKGYAQTTTPPPPPPVPGSDDTLLPYQKFPTLPAFNIREMDSTSIFNTYNIPEGKTSVLMLFSPDCEHCQHATEALTKGMDSLKNVNFYLVSPVHNMTAIKDFYKKYHLGNYKNIKVVGQDYEFFFFSYYGAHFVPCIAVYDNHKKFVKRYEGGITVKELYEDAQK